MYGPGFSEPGTGFLGAPEQYSYLFPLFPLMATTVALWTPSAAFGLHYHHRLSTAGELSVSLSEDLHLGATVLADQHLSLLQQHELSPRIRVVDLLHRNVTARNGSGTSAYHAYDVPAFRAHQDGVFLVCQCHHPRSANSLCWGWHASAQRRKTRKTVPPGLHGVCAIRAGMPRRHGCHFSCPIFLTKGIFRSLLVLCWWALSSWAF